MVLVDREELLVDLHDLAFPAKDHLAVLHPLDNGLVHAVLDDMEKLGRRVIGEASHHLRVFI